MKSSRELPFAATLTVLFGLLVTAQLFAATKERVLYSFCSSYGCPDGLQPFAGMIFDAAGNLYGTTTFGGFYTFGAVVELSPSTNGKWTEKVLHSFNNATDGYDPWAGLILDASGKLYGTTLDGGTYHKGTVFELTQGKKGDWTEKLLHSFNPEAKDGAGPAAGLVLDGNGNLYGTTSEGGANSNCNYGCGTVFELTQSKDGGWTEKILHSFNGKDGDYPVAGLILDKSGNLYGTTEFGGANDYGAVFELMRGAKDKWTEKVLHSFNGKDGITPCAGLVFDANGNLYGTTLWGGLHDYGSVFELVRGAKDKWTEKVLHSFNYNGNDGALPSAGLIFDASGSLYGTTQSGGANHTSDCIREGCGTVFELTLGKHGKWTEKVLHSFDNNGTDGFEPQSSVILDRKGKLYGTTVIGGAPGSCNERGYGCGTVFEITP
jgi:uncharacterized repeat protein (TIGR03803 family)